MSQVQGKRPLDSKNSALGVKIYRKIDPNQLMFTDFDLPFGGKLRTNKRIRSGKVFFSRKFPNNIQAIARQKLRILNNAVSLEDLRIPPANRLEALKGERKGHLFHLGRNRC